MKYLSALMMNLFESNLGILLLILGASPCNATATTTVVAVAGAELGPIQPQLVKSECIPQLWSQESLSRYSLIQKLYNKLVGAVFVKKC